MFQALATVLPQQLGNNSFAGGQTMSDFGRELLACAVEGTDPAENPLRHVADLAPRQARPQAWPHWADPDVVRAFHDRGITAPWSHQSEAADLAHDGRHVVLSTGTASGKSLAYQLPILTAFATERWARSAWSYQPPMTATARARYDDSRANGRAGSSPTPT